MKSLGVVLKISERCNINCSYCYFFNGKDASYKERPSLITEKTVMQVAKFLKDACIDLKLESLSIGFHGGEPLMYKKANFATMCNYFISELQNLVDLEFTLQTNAMLVDEQWIELFNRYNIKVGVSIDGPKEYHDTHRVDFRNKGTYERVVSKVLLLTKHQSMISIGGVGALCVINPAYDGKKIYRHFVDDLLITRMDFLLPDYTHDDVMPYSVDQYGKYMCAVFNEWVTDDNPDIEVRFSHSVLRLFLGKTGSLTYGNGPAVYGELPLICIRGDGEVGPTDELMSTNPKSVTLTKAFVDTISAKQLLMLPIFTEINKAQTDVPEACQECCWYNVCGSGGIVHRFSNKNRFNNPSLYCNSLKDYYAEVAKYLLNQGYPLNNILARLGLLNTAVNCEQLQG